MTGTFDNVIGTGVRGIGLLATDNILVMAITESRYALALLLVLVVADFRFGWGESNKRYEEAKKNGDKRRMDLYRWRTSRAVRHSLNKLTDYVIIIAMGMIIGMSLLEPIGINHMFGIFGASAVMAMCEISSIFGHFFYLHGVKVDKRGIPGFCKALAIAIAKRKDTDVGEALEETLNKSDNDTIRQ